MCKEDRADRRAAIVAHCSLPEGTVWDEGHVLRAIQTLEPKEEAKSRG
jgi:hypothetical protein